MPCLKCNNSDDESITCDGCDRRIRLSRSNLNAIDLKVMTLRGGKHNLKIFVMIA